MCKRFLVYFVVLLTHQTFAIAGSERGAKINRESMEITFQILKTEPTIGDAIESMRKFGVVSAAEVDKAKRFVQSKSALDAPLAIKVDAAKGKMQVGSVVLFTKSSGDLATADGRLLGISDDLPFSVLFERAFQRMNEPSRFSILNVFISPAYAEKNLMFANLAAAYAAADYAVTRALARFAAENSARSMCKENVNLFAKASEVDAKRKQAYGDKAGAFVCDATVPDGVRRYAPKLNAVAERDAARLKRSDELKAGLRIPLNANATKAEIKRCEDSVSASQLAELAQLDSAYETDGNMRGLLLEYGLRKGTLFRCSEASIAVLESIDVARRAAKMINNLRYSDFLLSNCGKLTNCDRAIFGDRIDPGSRLKSISDPTQH